MKRWLWNLAKRLLRSEFIRDMDAVVLQAHQYGVIDGRQMHVIDAALKGTTFGAHGTIFPAQGRDAHADLWWRNARRSLAAALALLAILASPLAAQESTIYEHIPHTRLRALQARVVDAPGAALAASEPVAAPAPSPAPLLSPASANGDPFTVSVTVGGLVTFGSEAPAEVTPTAYLEAEGPLIVGELPLGRIGARVGLSTAPGESLDISDPATFQAGDVGLWAGRVVGRRIAKDADGVPSQDITTTAVVEWGFSSRIAKGTTEPADRLVRHYGAGLRFQERQSGASLTVLYGRDESAGDRGWGQWIAYGSLPIPATKGTIALVADATLSVGPAQSEARQRDVFRAGVVVDLAQLVREVRD